MKSEAKVCAVFQKQMSSNNVHIMEYFNIHLEKIEVAKEI